MSKNKSQIITEEMLCMLRENINKHISGHRFSHTLSVEKEIIKLCHIFSLSESETAELRAAALLHDITKEKSPEEHKKLCMENGIPFGNDECESPKVFHAITAEAVIKKHFADYAVESILSPIRYHTTGKENMTLGEKLLYLADYIEETRKFPDCELLRKRFYSVLNPADNAHLDKILILSFKMTISNLLEEGARIHPATVASYNSLLSNRKEQ